VIPIKDKASLLIMEEGGRLLAQVFEEVIPQACVGVNTLALDQLIEREILLRKMVPMAKGYKGYKHASCISLNDEVVHGVPSATKILGAGDLVKIDVCTSFKGYCVDMTRMVFVGAVTDKVKKLAQVAQSALDKGIAQAREGNYVSDISAAIQREVEAHGFGVVRAFAGHGIGKKMHEDPEILNYGKPGRGERLRQGMTLALEPMITAGAYDIYIARDGWTAKTVDHSIAAHVEDTVVVTEGEPTIVTRLSSGIESESARI